MPQPPLDHLDPQNILLIKPSALGDIIHALPVLSALRQRFPQAQLSWVVNRIYEPLLYNHPDLDTTIPFDRGAGRAGMLSACRAWGRLWQTLRRGAYDLVLDLQGLLRSGLMTFATGAPRRVGLAGSREGARWFYTDVIADPGRQGLHAVDRYWRIVEALGAGETPKRFRLCISPQGISWVEEKLRGYPHPWMVVGAGSRWLTKRWPPEHFTTLATWAQAEFGGTILLVGTPDEAPLSTMVRERVDGPCLDLTGKTTLPQLVALLARADVMLANDTGPLHLAAALGRPVVAPYTCTKAALTGPYGQTDHVIETQVWCAGSYRRQCDRLECMSELTPPRIWPKLREVLRACRPHLESA